jgi:hypothetical protein
MRNTSALECETFYNVLALGMWTFSVFGRWWARGRSRCKGHACICDPSRGGHLIRSARCCATSGIGAGGDRGGGSAGQAADRPSAARRAARLVSPMARQG